MQKSLHSTWGKIQLTTESCRATRWLWRFSDSLQLKIACSGGGAISPLFLLCQPLATMPGFLPSQSKMKQKSPGVKKT